MSLISCSVIMTAVRDETSVLIKLIDGRSFDVADGGPLGAVVGIDVIVDMTRGDDE